MIVQPLPSTPKPSAEPPHRALNDKAYNEILTFLAGMSVAIERSPSTFADIGEEPLRDWFLVALNGSFKGDATGELSTAKAKPTSPFGSTARDLHRGVQILGRRKDAAGHD